MDFDQQIATGIRRKVVQAREDGKTAKLRYIRKLRKAGMRSPLSEVAQYPCGSTSCSAGHPSLCNNDCVRNGRGT